VNRTAHKIFPVGLLIEKKPCLVIGGGKIAARKVSLLLDAGADVTVIAPEITDDILSFVTNNRIRHVSREFNDSDITGFELVYCATNNKILNNSILALCRNLRILCCSIDNNWIDGDFLTPATVRQNEFTVSISTGGKACRRSRLVKSSISRHISLIDQSTLVVIGTSHLELPVSRRETIHCKGDDYVVKGEMLRQLWGIHEFVFVNTCNRLELYFAGPVNDSLIQLVKMILQLDKLDAGEFYLKEGIDAFEHGVALCAGLLSQLPGEHHIASQLKDAVSQCSEYRWSDTLMKEWFSSTLHLSRELRQATSHIIKSIDIEELTLKYITSVLNVESSPTFTIIGTGMVGSKLLTIVLDTFKNSRVNFVYHNTIPVLPDAYSYRVNVVQLGGMYSSISASDIIISAINSDTPVITADHAQILKADSILIDLSVPRTIDPALGTSLTSQKLIDMDNLKIWYRLEQVDRNQLLAICKEIVVENREMYDKFITSITGQLPNQ